MTIKIEQDFATRADLDSYVRSTFGENPDNNKAITLELTQMELDKLSLSDKTLVYGVKVKVKLK